MSLCTRIALTIVASAAVLAGCTQDFEAFEPTQGSSSAGGSTATVTPTTGSSVASTGGMGGMGGAGPECTATDTKKCPTDPLICNSASCTAEGKCSTENDPAHTMCATGVCDGNGACIGCVDKTDCPMTAPICNLAKCIPAGCGNGIKDGDETDIDCGGSCNPCINTKMCLVPTDCVSGNCANLVCAPCTVGPTGGCDAATQYCDPTNNGGTCTTLIAKGAACTDVTGSTCATTHCEEGLCCDQACTDDCLSCLNKNNGGTDGTCGTAESGKDPHGSCATAKSGASAADQQCLTGSCDGTATVTCGFEAAATPCGAAASCPSTTSQKTHQACDATGTCNQGAVTSACAGHFTCDAATGLACATTCTAGSTQCLSNFFCDVKNGSTDKDQCETCVANADCNTPTPTCDTNNGSFLDSCQQCSSTDATNCPVAAPVCLTTSDTCVQCVSSGDCSAPGKTVCKTATNVCVQCLVNTDCGSTTTTPACNGSDVCGCTANSDCGAVPGKHACDTSKLPAGLCEQCAVAGDCTGNVNGASCLSNDTCGCTVDGNCSALVATPVCDTTTKLCAACTVAEEATTCSGTTPICNASSVCAKCTGNPDCAPGLPGMVCEADGSCGS